MHRSDFGEWIDSAEKRLSQLEQMEALATPLDEWCENCEEKLATTKSADGVAVCADCAGVLLKAMGVVPINRADRRKRERAKKAAAQRMAGRRKRRKR